MKSKLYFWKDNRKSTKTLGVIILVIVLILVGSVSGWYYLVYIPHKQHEEELQRKEKAIQAKISQVSNFYDTHLTGGSIEHLSILLSEMYKSRLKLSLSGYGEQSVDCTTTGCTFNYFIQNGHVFNLQDKDFWGRSFSGSFSEKEVSFTDIPSKLDSNILLEKYKATEGIAVPECSVMLNYIYSLNSSGIISGKFEVTQPPASSVISVEKELNGRGKHYGLLFGSWMMETKDNSIPHLISIFNSQAFKDDFIIKNVNFKLDVVSISGEFVCKTGN